MPTCASAPIRSSSAISVAVVIPPAAVRRASPAARTAAATAWKSNPPIPPSCSTCVKRNPPTRGASARIRSSTGVPVAVRHPSTTTWPCSASTAAITRSRGRAPQNSGVAAVPIMIRAAPASSHARAVSKSRMPPPTRHDARLTISRIKLAFEPLPSAASRSTTATSPATANCSSVAMGSPPSSTNSRPRRSCTARPCIRSMLGMIIGAPGSRAGRDRP